MPESVEKEKTGSKSDVRTRDDHLPVLPGAEVLSLIPVLFQGFFFGGERYQGWGPKRAQQLPRCD